MLFNGNAIENRKPLLVQLLYKHRMHALRTRALHLKMDFELKPISIKDRSKAKLSEGLLPLALAFAISNTDNLLTFYSSTSTFSLASDQFETAVAVVNIEQYSKHHDVLLLSPQCYCSTINVHNACLLSKRIVFTGIMEKCLSL